jgi:HEAT repeat protein
MKRILLLLLSLALAGCTMEPTHEGKAARVWRTELKHSDPMARWHAAAAIAVMEAPKDAIPDLIECLKDDAYYVRAEAAVALGRMAPHAKAAVPALTELMKNDSNEKVRIHAAAALKRIDMQAVMQAEDDLKRGRTR